jgi:hypothetical protein
MTRRSLLSLAALGAVMSTAAFSTPVTTGTVVKWPPWVSIEAPVNPFDATARGAVLLVHTAFREGVAQMSDLTGTAEGLVNGTRRTIPLRFETTGRPNVFALRRQWPTEGTWLARINLRGTTAIVRLDSAGNVASVGVPTAVASDGMALPRAVSSREIDSTLASSGRR